MNTLRVLFVCLGNICRSPTAQGVFEQRIEKHGLSSFVAADSAGTSGWHIGKKPDARTISAALGRGYRLEHLRARQIDMTDFESFDFILVMDNDNLREMEALKPAKCRASLRLLLDYAKKSDVSNVPDPYYGGHDGFELVLDLIEEACDEFIGVIQHQLSRND